MDLTAKLEDVFPYARSIKALVPEQADGSFVAEVLLPVKDGESVVQVYRFPHDADGDHLPYEDRLTWHTEAVRSGDMVVPKGRTSFGAGRWAFFVSWDGVASYHEIRALVENRVATHGLLGDPVPA